tara:strand:- start:175 stop:1140 length:966 start_codon:yes stop_codon:yes gene_type:complete
MNPNTLIIGGLCLGSSLNKESSFAFLQKAYELGIRDIDTGSLYGNGNSELYIAEFINKTKNSFLVHTKIGLERVMRDDGSFGVKLNELNSDYIINETKSAISRLGIKKIHRLSLHAFCKKISINEQVKALDYLIKNNLIESYGICNFEYSELEAWLDCCAEFNLTLPSSLDLHLNLFEQKASIRILPLLTKFSIEAIPYRVFCRGILADRYKESLEIPENSRACSSWRVKRYINQENLNSVKKLKLLAQKNKMSLLELVLHWVFSFQCISKICVGTSCTRQLEDIVNANNSVFSSEKNILEMINYCLPQDYLSKPDVFFET